MTLTKIVLKKSKNNSYKVVVVRGSNIVDCMGFYNFQYNSVKVFSISLVRLGLWLNSGSYLSSKISKLSSFLN